MSVLCICAFCHKILDSRLAMKLVRMGAIAFCDAACRAAWITMLDEKVDVEVHVD